MNSQVNYAIVGLFVIILGLGLIGILLWFIADFEKIKYNTYQVYTKESVSGLNSKASVKYRGVKVGYVRDISLVAERDNEVRVLLDIEDGIQLKQDTLAILSVQGLTGLAYIELIGGSRDSPLLVVKDGQNYPEVKTKASLFLRLETKVLTLLNKVDQVFSDKNRLAINNILQNIEQSSNSFIKTEENINKLISLIDKAVTDSRRDIDYFTTLALPEMIKSLAELRLLLNSLRGFVQELGSKPNMLLFGKSSVPEGPGE
jgi:phospholipid/cholesterol/gamma-HCH transport system substrate-binding protein